MAFFSFSIFRNYPCPQCDLKFLGTFQRNIHVRRAHNQERLHECSYCDKTFFTKTRLTDHINIHEGIKPFSCDTCGQLFRTKTNLDSHVGIHTGVKRYKCGLCPVAYACTSSVSRHRQSHKVNGLFGCSICPDGFKTIRYLMLHLRNDHSIYSVSNNYNIPLMSN